MLALGRVRLNVRFSGVAASVPALEPGVSLLPPEDKKAAAPAGLAAATLGYLLKSAEEDIQDNPRSFLLVHLDNYR